MPQIWPMSWVTLFAFFVLTLYFFINIIYFTELNNSVSLSAAGKTESSKCFSLPWKW
nr:ATP synthase F0 subunit 8 [Scapholeberis mucronata]